MREYENFQKSPGGPKKFLYTGPSKDRDEYQWNFPPKSSSNTNNNMPVDLNGVWSIKRNVSLKNGSGLPVTSSLSHNADKTFYSRHGGVKDAGKGAMGGAAGTNGKQDMVQWRGARGATLSYPAFHQRGDHISSPTFSPTSRGYVSSPSAHHFNPSSWQSDENEF